MRTRLLVLLVALALVAGCSSDSKDDAASTSSTSSSSTSTTIASTTSSTALVGSTDEQTAGGTAQGMATLRQLRVSSEPGVDRVTFLFQGEGIPTVDVVYQDHPTQDGSGAPVEAEGTASLHVRFEPSATVDMTSEKPKTVYEDSDRVTGKTTNVTEVVKAGEFEAVLSWVIGLRSKAPFRIRTVDMPALVIIEIGTPSA